MDLIRERELLNKVALLAPQALRSISGLPRQTSCMRRVRSKNRETRWASFRRRLKGSSVSTFAVKPRPFGAPRCGFGA